jgi:ABC-type nitrate/sulfonate/bicarbonate transport system substrate-binding protein
MYAAYHKGFFAAEGLDVELYKVTAGYNTSKLLSSGTIDGSPGILFTYLKPIERGADVRISGGLHGNCLRVVLDKNSGITKASDFKGKAIGVGFPGDHPGRQQYRWPVRQYRRSHHAQVLLRHRTERQARARPAEVGGGEKSI